MSKTFIAFVVLAVVSGIVGVLGNNPAIDGAGKAFFGVFFTLAFITRMAERTSSPSKS